MNLFRKTISITIVIVFAAISFGLSAQTLEEATNAYNNGVAKANDDPKSAIELFQQSIKISSALGDEGKDLLELAQSQLPQLQYKLATNIYKEKNYDLAIKEFEKAVEMSKQYGNEKILAKAGSIIPKLNYSLGSSYYKKDDFEKALGYLSNAIKYDDTYAKAFLTEALIYKKMEKEEEMFASVDNTIKAGNASGDEKSVASAKKIAQGYLLISANNDVQAENFTTAVEKLNKSLAYGKEKAEVFYLLALSNNKLSKYDDALAAVQNGLAVEDDSNEAKAKFFFEQGNAFAGKGDNGSACASYKKAAYGNYTEQANYQINTVLKCN